LLIVGLRNRALAANQEEGSVFEAADSLDVAFGKTEYRMRFAAGSGDLLARRSVTVLSEGEVAAKAERHTGLAERRKAKFEAFVNHELDGAGVMDEV
jgi:hypothetical protein